MRSVAFTFAEGASEERRRALLAEIAAWDGVASAGLLSPDSPRGETRRVAYARLDENADAESLVRRLRALPEIASASLPARRGPARRGPASAHALLAAALLPLASLLTAPARAERLPIRAYTTADGLPHDRVKRIVADSHGFLWLCTTEGLARFDGHAFTAYEAAQGMPVPSANDLVEIEGRGYWVATNGGGVAFFDPKAAGRSRFRVFPVGDYPAASRVNVLFLDRAGRLWAGTDGGLFRRDSAQPGPGAFLPVPLGFASRPDAVVQVWSIAEDDSGVVWAGTKYGLAGISADPVMRRPVAPRETDQVLALLADADGRLFVGHENAGLLVYDAGALRDGLPPARRYARADGLAGDRVTALLRVEGALLAATDGGLSEAKDASAKTLAFESYGRAQGISDDGLSGLARDRDGNLWISTLSGGALRLARSGVVTYAEEDGLGRVVSGVFLGNEGELLAASSGWRLSRFDGRAFTTVVPRLPPTLPPSRWRVFQGTLVDRSGEVWLATGEGLCRYAKPARFEDLAKTPPARVYTTSDGLASDDVSHLYEDARGDVWIGTFTPVPDGLVRYERATRSFRRYGAKDGLPALVSVAAFAEDRAKTLWVALREGGLARASASGFQLLGEKDGLPPAPIVSLLADRAGSLWATTAGSGLVRLDDLAAPRPRVRVYGAQEGIDRTFLSGLVEDRAGRIFVGTSRDLRRLDPKTGAVTRIGAADGLVASEVLSGACDASGALWLGSWRGLSRYVAPPERLTPPPAVRIGGLGVSGVEFPVSDLGETALDAGRLAPSGNHLRVEFFSLGAGGAEDVLFQHFLEGADREWSPPGTQRSVLLANLAPGKYRFLVRALDARQRTSAAPASVSFVVLPPLWRRWWFLALAGLAAGGVGYAIDHARAARRLAVERVRTRIATDLHDDIGASLSRIAVLTEVLGKKAPEHASRLSDIAALARELVVSMSDIVWATDPRRDDLASVARRLRSFASDVLEARGIAFECRVDPACEALPLAPDARRQLFLALKEAVTNAARHSDAKEARLTFALDGRTLVAEMTDDGRGLASSGGPRSSGFTHGTVHGMTSMKSRAEAAGGTFETESAPGRGTAVRIRIPVGAAA